jgi:hypothetical protein
MDERNDLPSTDADLNLETEAFSQCFGTAEEVIERYTHCALCGAFLHFTHVTDFAKNMTQETARCLECGVKARRLTHRLQ